MTVHVAPPSFRESSPESCPALVLNADYRPLSYYPLSLWSWQDTLKAVFLDRVNIVSEYDTVVRSPTSHFRLPSVVSLKTYVQPSRHPAFTRFNVFLRDKFACQYCGSKEELTFDHVVPRSKGGQTSWSNLDRAAGILYVLVQGFKKEIYSLAVSCKRILEAACFRWQRVALVNRMGPRP